MNDELKQAARIVVALESSMPDLAALDIVRHMLGDTVPELLALLIEDAELLQLAGSRLAREIVPSGEMRPLERTALKRQLRAQSTVLKQRFESTAARYGWRCSSEVSRYDVFTELARHARQSETLAVNLAARSATFSARWHETLVRLGAEPVRRLLLAREGWKSGKNILAFANSVASAQGITAVASQLARHSGSQLSLLLTGEVTQDEDSLERIAGSAEAAGVPIEAKAVGNVTPADVVTAARKQRARLVIVPWPEGPDDAEMVTRLLTETPSAVLLIR